MSKQLWLDCIQIRVDFYDMIHEDRGWLEIIIFSITSFLTVIMASHGSIGSTELCGMKSQKNILLSLYRTMSACALRRFGPGTPCTKPETVNSPQTIALKKDYERLLAERASLDSQWTQPQQEQSCAIQPYEKSQSQQQKVQEPTSLWKPIFVPKVGTRGF